MDFEEAGKLANEVLDRATAMSEWAHDVGSTLADDIELLRAQAKRLVWEFEEDEDE